ncbi:MAG: hypothetical protein HQ498_12170, partial [Pseudohongiella sp.]|nr:hypothetical protein [Pseudohongiella sp.]
MTKNFLSSQYRDEQQLNEYIQQSIRNWRVGVVLCSYKKLSKPEMQALACKWAGKIDDRYGCVKRGKKYNISQRIEKVLMLEYTENKRGWHVNAVLNKPTGVSDQDFEDALRDIWFNVIAHSWQADMLQADIKLFWSATDIDGFRHYAFKKRTQLANE